MELSRSKYYQWRDRYGKANEHNVLVPRDHWLEQWEKDAIVDFHHQFPLEGYRRLTFMMLDRDIVAVSPSSTYRVLKGAGLLDSWKPKSSFKGTGFVQPLSPHEHWHVDVSYALLREWFAINKYDPGVDSLKPVDGSAERGLSGARWADDHDYLATGDGRINVFEHMKVAIELVDLFDDDQSVLVCLT